ncbi:hypothetical protein FIBSPDRAFT_768897 [Athelia psychrophila]|uniref:Uncharacterized protein n=1 Tax=Athelia psychrophila TaxID=1759441 RepID=A0A167U0L7_9AGAM|nr:hypothetical protein FIBSPDRAFT_768897 [Fibularhizoctonia sp. CBS 109695]
MLSLVWKRDTDCTLKLLDTETEHLGTSLRSFAANTCEAFNTQELARETAARNRRTAKNATTPQAAPSVDPSRKRKKYNLRTIKHHLLGYHAKTIRMFGTSDSYSPERGELEHRTPKTWYVRTSGKEFVKQMTGIERREARIRRIRERLYPKGKQPAVVPSIQDPNAHHHIGISQTHPVDIGSFLRDNAGDPATKDFWLKLKANLLPRILDQLKATPDFDASGLPAPEECDADRVIVFKEPRIYQHQILHVNYTSYDVRRLQDIINARSSHNNIMVLSHSDDDTSPRFRYGRLLGTYHVKAIYLGPGLQNHNSHHMEFLWVRWYDQVERASTGWDHRRLDRVQFAPINDDDAFGIVDPATVLRGCHVIPRFALGPKYSDPLQGLSHLASDSTDWIEYYVNRYVDRDMVMRYHFGLGVGHVYSHQSALIHLPTTQVATSSSTNTGRTTGIADVSHLATSGPSGSVTHLGVAEPGVAEVEDSDGDEDLDFGDSDSDFLGSDTSDDSYRLGLDGDVDNAELEELAAEEMYYE